MLAYAKLKKLRIPARKTRLVANLIRGKQVSHAFCLLDYEPRKAALFIKKLLRSAVANWHQKQKTHTQESPPPLYVKEIYVDSASMLKRVEFAAQGRTRGIRKRSCHVTLAIAEETPTTPASKTPRKAQHKH